MNPISTRSQRTRIKFCGITRAEDAAVAIALGVDALGFVLVPSSARFMTPATAAIIRAALPPLVSVVALFSNADEDFVRESLALLKPDLLQFHGEEDAEFCGRFGVPYMKAVAMTAQTSLMQQAALYPAAAALLLDSHAPGGMGGSGRSFDWKQVQAVGKPIVLAGGLRPDNVGEGIRSIRPYAVDVSSGIELQPGIKCPEKMRAFVTVVRAADQELLNRSADV
ncbi:MAG: phosphoribosylanthranilate isomerase [Stenotrophobium sp.]